MAASRARRAHEVADPLPPSSAVEQHEVPLSTDEMTSIARDLVAEQRDLAQQFRYFQNYAMPLYDKGWMPVPQTRLGGDRRPGRVDKRGLQWGKYTTARPDRETVAYWARDPDAGACNVAVILGEPSGNTFGIDIDILGAANNRLVQQIAFEVLGDTMVRYGKKPKALMLYRVEDAADLPHYGKFVLAGPDGQPDGDIVEILGNGRMVTFVGLHHSTGELFQFDNGQPQLHSPADRVTVVTKSQIDEFFRVLVDRLTLFVPPRAQHADIDLSAYDADGIRVPHIHAWSGGEWIETDGLVSDGREAFMYSVAREYARNNPHEEVGTLVPMVVAAFREREHQARAWPLSKALEQAEEKVARALRSIRDGRIKPARRKAKDETTTAADVVQPIERRAPEVRTEGPPLSFLPARRRSTVKVRFSAPNAEKAAQRALRTDRDAVGDEAAAQNLAGIDAFIEDVIAGQNRVHVLSGATGIGKSSMTLKRLATRRSDIFDRIVEVEDAEGASKEMAGLVMLVATYNNVEDLRLKARMLNLDGNATDAELVEAAALQGIVAEGDLKDHLAQLKRFAVGSGLTYMVYKGKVAAGCLRAEEMRLLQSANVPTSAMCKTRVPVKDTQGRPTGQHEDSFCQFYKSCPAIAQRAELKGKDLVFMVRNFLTLALPEELQAPRGLIVDERFFDLLIHETSMPMSTLDIARKPPILGKKEWKAGMRPDDLLQDREEAVGHAKEVLLRRGDLARYFYDLQIKRDGGKLVRGIELVGAARRVCGSAMTSQADLSPDLTKEDIVAMCAAPRGTRIGEEYRFWKLLEEQIEALQTTYLDSTVVLPPDNRIRVLGETHSEDGNPANPDIQLAWRSEANWSGVPTLLLDASTDRVITSLALGGRDVVMHEAEVSLNQHVVLSVDRRLSMRSLFPGKNASVEARIEAASLLHDLRQSVAMFAGTHAHGRVLLVLPMRLRRALLLDWDAPQNLDVRHYNAVAGLDFARRHVGMSFMSRLELPVRTVDGLVAALGHGMMQPEAPIDPLGTGQDADGEDLAHHIVRHDHPLRDGGTATWDLDEYAGDLARRIQRQYREEQQLQGIGRLRTVYRLDAGMVLGITATPPQDLVADEVLGLKDLTISGPLWDAARSTGGIINAKILARYASHLGEVEQFEVMIAEHFLSSPLVVSRYHRATAVLEDGTEEHFYVAGHHVAWRQRLVAELKALGWKGSLRDCVDCAVHTPAAEDAPRDDIDTILEAMGAVNGEARRLSDLAEKLMARGEWRPGAMGGWHPFKKEPVNKAPAAYRAGDGEFANKPAPLGVWMALEVVQAEWVRDGMLSPEEMAQLGLTEDTVRPRKVA